MVTKENLVYNLNKRLHRKIKQLSPANVRTGAELGYTIPQFDSIEALLPHIYKVWKPYSSTFTNCGNCIPPLLLGVESLFPHNHNVEKPYTPHILKVETVFPHFYKVWKPYSTTFYKVWKPYSLMFTSCGNSPPPHLQGVETFSPHI